MAGGNRFGAYPHRLAWAERADRRSREKRSGWHSDRLGSQQLVHGPRRLPVHRRRDVAVDVERDGDRRMAEHLGHILSGNEVRRARQRFSLTPVLEVIACGTTIDLWPVLSVESPQH